MKRIIKIAVLALAIWPMIGCATGGLVTGPFSSMAVASNERAMVERRGAGSGSSMTAGEIFKNVLGIIGDSVLYYGVSEAIQQANDDDSSGAPAQAYSVSGNGNTVIIGNGAGVSVDNSHGE